MPKVESDKNVRYVEGAVLSMLRLRRYLLSRGVDPDEVESRIRKQALGMLEASGLPKERIVKVLKELKHVVDSLIEIVETSDIGSEGEE